VKRSRVRGGSLFWLLSLLVALSMVCGTVLILLPQPERRARPTAPPLQPTLTPMLAEPSPSPLTATPTPTVAAAPSPPPRPTA
jgi:hypothetical protein